MMDFLRTFLIFLVICGALAFVFRDDLRKLAGMQTAPSGAPTDLDPEALKNVYSRLKIEPLGSRLLSHEDVWSALKDLTISFCDKTAIYRLSKGLAAAGERKPAATALLAFAGSCPNAGGERYAAANMLFGMGDYAAVLPIADDLIKMRPEVAQYYYTRGQALSALGRHEEAIHDFTSALALVDDLKRVNSQIFTGLASAYAATGKPCQAMTAIQTFVYADALNRDTAQARKLISDYGTKGNCTQNYARGSEVIPRTRPDVTIVKAAINGVNGIFVLDTGASLVTLAPEFAKRSNVLPATSARPLLVHTANGVSGAALTTLESVAVGNLRAEKVTAALLSKPIAPGIDGLLGMSFLARFDVALESKVVRIKERVTSTTVQTAE
jgi:aspartyl protease family protein